MPKKCSRLPFFKAKLDGFTTFKNKLAINMKTAILTLIAYRLQYFTISIEADRIRLILTF